MRFAISFLISASLMAPAYGQVFRLTREQMIKYTAKNPFDRFPGGAVSDGGIEGFMWQLRVNEHSH